jgi:hypothetical protein
MHETIAVKVGEHVHDRLKHCSGFVRLERPVGENLRKVLLGTLHYDIDKGNTAKLETSHLIKGNQVRMGQLRRLLPTPKLQLAIFWSRGNEFDSGFFKTFTLMALCEEHSAVFGSA